jgi:hypothetical protein
MSRYEHTQPGWPTLLSLAILAMMALAFVLAMGAPLSALISVAGMTLLLAALFPSLTVRVADGRLSLRYGLGVIRKSYALSEVRSARPVRNRWWYGWGIRLTPHGWLYNISGLDAVEIQLASGRRVRIGSDEPERLARAVEAAVHGAD